MTTSSPATEAELRAALIAESSDVCAAPEILARVQGAERRARSRGRRLAPVAVAVAVAAAAVVLATTSTRGHSGPGPVLGEPSGTAPATGTSTTGTSTTGTSTTGTSTTATSTTATAQPVDLAPTEFSGLTLRHPASWRYVPVEFISAGPSGGLGWLTNEPTIAQCTTVAGVRSCGWPVARLSSGGVLVSVSARFIGQNTINANTTIAGFPAETSQPDIGTDCPTGATYALGAAINVTEPTYQSTIYVSTCAADNTATTRAVIAAMLATATYLNVLH
jgi:hypothetical protein